MGSTKIAAAVLAIALLAGCTMRTQALVSTTAYDFSERDAYGQSFAASPTYAGQDTSWTTTAPARAIGGLWQEKAPGGDAAPAKAKGAEAADDGKIALGSPAEGGAPAASPAPPRPTATPAQTGQSPSVPGSGALGR